MKRLWIIPLCLLFVFTSSTKHSTTVNGAHGSWHSLFTDPANGEVEDGTLTTCAAHTVGQSALSMTGMSFAIPAGATVDSFAIMVKHKKSAGSDAVMEYVLLLGGTPATYYWGQAHNVAVSEALTWDTYRGNAAYWSNFPLIPDSVNSALFGIGVVWYGTGSATVSVDAMQGVAYYTEAGTGTRTRGVTIGALNNHKDFRP